jgi:hypothetical protein
MTEIISLARIFADCARARHVLFRVRAHRFSPHADGKK